MILGSLCEREAHWSRFNARKVSTRNGKNRDILTRRYLLTSRSVSPPPPNPSSHLHNIYRYVLSSPLRPERIYNTDNKAFNEVAGGIWWQGSTRRVHCARPSCLECIN